MPSATMPRLTTASARASGSSQAGVAGSMTSPDGACAASAASVIARPPRRGFGAAGRRSQQLLRGRQQRLARLAALGVVLPGGVARDGLPLAHGGLVDVVDLRARLRVDLGGDAVVG